MNGGDLADTIDDLICSFESDGKTMDTLIMYLFCWALVGFAALAIGKYAYSRTVGYAARKSGGRTAAEQESSSAADRKLQQQQQQSSPTQRGAVPPTPPVGRKRLGSKTAAGRTSAAVAGVAAGLSAVPAAAAANKAYAASEQTAHLPHHHQRPPPAATGNDPDAVRWTNAVFKWLYDAAAGGEPAVVEYLLGEWTATLNDYTKKSFAEVSNACATS